MTAEPKFQFQPPPPDAERLPRYLEQHQSEFAARYNQHEHAAPANLGILWGAADDVSATTGGNFITGYAESGQSGSLTADSAAGSITVTEAGVYSLSMWALVNQNSSTKEESLFLDLDVTGAVTDRAIVAVYDVATDKTSLRHLMVRATRQLPATTVLRLRLSATAGLGTMNVIQTSFEVALLQAA